MGAIFQTLWGKILAGAAGALLALAALFCVLWILAARGEAEAIKERDEAIDQRVKAELETERTTRALEAAEARAAARRERATEQQRDEERLQDEPETNFCGASPAIRRALNILRERRTDNPPVGDDTGNP